MIKLLAQPAPAKLNLYLRVTGRRPDGYHELDSIFLPIPLCDHVALGLRSAAEPAVHLHCDYDGLGPAAENLTVRAAHAFMREFGLAADITIDLRKKIPVGAGLGGGSSDAAAVLRMLAELCGSSERQRLARVALSLGADVPFFIDPQPARAGGIGERLTLLQGLAPLHLLLAAPPVNVATAEVFRRLTPEGWSGPASPAAVDAIVAGRITSDLLVNDLAPVAIAHHPAIGTLRTALQAAGASAAAMTGSGGAVFGIFPSAAAVAAAAPRLRALHPNARIIGCDSTASPGGFTEF